MLHQDHDDESLELYEDQFNPLNSDRQARRKRKPKAKHTPKKAQREILEEVADLQSLEGGFQTTYQPSLYESGWLLESLRSFYDEQYITDILAVVKGGKEATVYRCEAHPRLGVPLVAAKVYRPRMFRQLRNDKTYREGRAMLQADGHEITERDTRTRRALQNKSSYGADVEHTSWLMHEYTVLSELHLRGGDVPKVLSASANAILMEYRGDERMSAPTLSEVTLEDAAEARQLFERVMWNIELMLENSVIHGDLSAYNILYWEGAITLIDFPQIVDPRGNPEALAILGRDIARVCDYFAGYGVNADAAGWLRRLWRQHVGSLKRNRVADASRFEPEED